MWEESNESKNIMKKKQTNAIVKSIEISIFRFPLSQLPKQSKQSRGKYEKRTEESEKKILQSHLHMCCIGY